MDARLLYIVVVLFTTFDTQVLALNSTSTVAPTPTSTPAQSSSSTTPTPTTVSAATTTGTPATVTWTSIVSTIATTRATTTPAMSASVTSTPTPPFETRLEVILQVEEKCSDVIKANLTTGIKSIYSHKDYDYKNMQLIQTDDKEKCTVNITVTFGRKLKLKDIEKRMKDAAKSGVITTIKIELLFVQVQVEGVTLGKEYMPSKDDCTSKCCDGAGGPIEVKRTCEPEHKCGNYNLTKTAGDCSKVCKNLKDLCSAGKPLQSSLVILIFGFFVNWLFKE